MQGQGQRGVGSVRRLNRMIEDWLIPAGMVVAFIVLVLAVKWWAASNEAASYRKFCNTPVTTWDAVWLDLRIDECTKCDDG